MLTLGISLKFIKILAPIQKISRYFNQKQLTSLFTVQFPCFSCYTLPHVKGIWVKSWCLYMFKVWPRKVQLGIHLLQIQWDIFIWFSVTSVLQLVILVYAHLPGKFLLLIVPTHLTSSHRDSGQTFCLDINVSGGPSNGSMWIDEEKRDLRYTELEAHPWVILLNLTLYIAEI